MRKRPPPSKLVRGLSVFRRRLKFPGGRPPSIVSAEKLNYCVRNGNRCDLLAIATEVSSKSDLFANFVLLDKTRYTVDFSSFPKSAFHWRFLGALRTMCAYAIRE